VEFFNFIIAILAAWRITSAINREKIGKSFRARFAGEKADAVIPNAFTYTDTFLSNLIMCFWCLSFWVSMFCTVMYMLYPLFLYPFAISALVMALDERVLKQWLGLTP